MVVLSFTTRRKSLLAASLDPVIVLAPKFAQVAKASPDCTPLSKRMLCSRVMRPLLPGLSTELPEMLTLNWPLDVMPPPATNWNPLELIWWTWLFVTATVMLPVPSFVISNPSPSDDPEFAVAATPTVLLLIVPLKLPLAPPMSWLLMIVTAFVLEFWKVLFWMSIVAAPVAPATADTAPPPVDWLAS